MSSSEIAPGVIARAKDGDEEAFHMIFRRYGRPVLSFLNHLVQNHAVAEELAQPTLYAALRAVPGLRKGRGEAKEPPPVRAPLEADVRRLGRGCPAGSGARLPAGNPRPIARNAELERG